MSDKIKLPSAKLKKIIREEIEKIVLQEQGINNVDTSDLREMVENAIKNMGEHSIMLKEAVYVLSTKGVENKVLMEILKTHSKYTKLLEDILGMID